jgi:hypothetical protein
VPLTRIKSAATDVEQLFAEVEKQGDVYAVEQAGPWLLVFWKRRSQPVKETRA